ncbi:MAG: spore photoproduct lyase, partial [Clostridiales bacterium]|nr:spore photoproduct lyase [Clostridiales bacterium]
MYPAKIYYEPEALNYESGRMLRKKYSNVEWIEIENHNSIPEFQ